MAIRIVFDGEELGFRPDGAAGETREVGADDLAKFATWASAYESAVKTGSVGTSPLITVTASAASDRASALRLKMCCTITIVWQFPLVTVASPLRDASNMDGPDGQQR